MECVFRNGAISVILMCVYVQLAEIAKIGILVAVHLYTPLIIYPLDSILLAN